ncbi:MAG: hypothetical protein LH679_11870, partial [Cyanobacteria bacterium CAN_BIN43]|nr:hypothetical protein [Cyanobacteria bacterium CAN_BIN43]
LSESDRTLVGLSPTRNSWSLVSFGTPISMDYLDYSVIGNNGQTMSRFSLYIYPKKSLSIS